MPENHNLKTLLLVGGLGTRLRPVIASVPKPLAQVGEGSFLELLVEQLRSQGFQNIVMCTGYLSEQIEKQFGSGDTKGIRIEYSREQSPLGTAGAVRLAEVLLGESREFLVMNGDSFAEVDLHRLIKFHRVSSGIATLAVSRVRDSARYGTVHVGESGRVTGFAEKTGQHEPGMINAGVYVFDRKLLDYIQEGPRSLEKDVFPQVLARGVFAMEQPGMFIDIGTPEDYLLAQELSGRLKEKALAVADTCFREECQ
jgi:D-glycero-alpha-D-manno-heptose 1-phosphate guanylyltransferase